MNEIIEIRHLRKEDYESMKAAMLRAYPRMGAYWREESITRLLDLFPEGQLVVTVNDEVVAAALAIVVSRAKFSDEHTYEADNRPVHL